MSRIHTGLAGVTALLLPTAPFSPVSQAELAPPPPAIVSSHGRRRYDSPADRAIVDPERQEEQILVNTQDVFRLKGETGLESTRFIFAAGPGGLTPTLVVREMPDGYCISLQVSVGEIGVELSLHTGAMFKFGAGAGAEDPRLAARNQVAKLLREISGGSLSLPSERDTMQMVGRTMSAELVAELVTLYKEEPKRAHFSRMPSWDQSRLSPLNRPPTDLERRAVQYFRILASESALTSNSPSLMNPGVVIDALASGFIVSVVNPAGRSPRRVLEGEFAAPHQIVTCIGKDGTGKVFVIAEHGGPYKPINADDRGHAFGEVVKGSVLSAQINNAQSLVKNPEPERTRWEARAAAPKPSVVTVEPEVELAAA